MIEINKCKLVPGITASWGDITGNIENQTDLVSYISTHGGGTAAWGSISGTLTDQTDLMDYMSRFATQSWVSSQGYLSSTALTGYATQSWVESQGYLTEHQDLSSYATQSWVESQGYLTEHQDLTGYATESWVSSQGYLSSTALTGYATESWVSGQGYLVSDDLSQYATRQWVTGRGYVSSSDLSSYATQSFVTSAISSAQASTVKYGTIDPLINTDIIDRPMIVDPDAGNISATEDYILGQLISLSNNGNTKFYSSIVVKGGTIVNNYKNYNKVNNEWVLTYDGDYTLVGFPEWESPIGSTDIYSNPDLVIPDGFDLAYEYFVQEGGGSGILIGRLYDGEIDGTPTLNYTGIRFDSESGIYGTYDYMAEDDGQGNVIYNEYIHQFMMDDDFQAFLVGDFTDLSGRVSTLESNYGDAVTTTNNILGV